MTAARPNFRKRGYTTRWDKAAANFRRQHPYCLGCQAIGRVMPTELVDHVEPHKGDQSKFWSTALWQPHADGTTTSSRNGWKLCSSEASARSRTYGLAALSASRSRASGHHLRRLELTDGRWDRGF